MIKYILMYICIYKCIHIYLNMYIYIHISNSLKEDSSQLKARSPGPSSTASLTNLLNDVGIYGQVLKIARNWLSI
jgi:hypothetical protein